MKNNKQASFIETPLQYAASIQEIPPNLKRISFADWVSENSLKLASKYLERFNIKKHAGKETLRLMERYLSHDLFFGVYIDEDDPEKGLMNFLLDEYNAMLANPNEK